MKNNQFKTFNLINQRPNVLILGNGLTRNTSISWAKLIQGIKRNNSNISLYKELEADGTFKRFIIPNTILTQATSIIDDTERRNRYSSIFNRSTYPHNTFLQQLLSLPFDAILTTNYSYELESEISNLYPSLRPDKKREYAARTRQNNDPVFLLHTFNHFTTAPDIWHIHGELRRPSSIVLTHDEYAKHIRAITQYTSDRRAEYDKKPAGLKFRSWVDYFIFGNVFVLGLGMDFSEFDLWWLLGRRLREKNKGTFIFYEGEKESETAKQNALKDVDTTINTLGMITSSKTDYGIFYQKAIDDIKSRLTP